MSRPTLGLLIALALGAPALASAAPTREMPAQVTGSSVAPAAAPAPAATSDSSRYAQREKQDKKVADYEGGSVIVIGASGTVLLALLILLLVI